MKNLICAVLWIVLLCGLSAFFRQVLGWTFWPAAIVSALLSAAVTTVLFTRWSRRQPSCTDHETHSQS